MSARLVLGAVAYDPKVVTIWEGFASFFTERGLDLDVVLYRTYESQVMAHLAGHVDVAWNSPLAWIETDRAARRQGRRASAIAMRDTDRDLTSVVVTLAGSERESILDLRGGRIAVGASDSPQATLIPLLHVAEAGLEPGRDVTVVRHEIAPGKHGDHVGGERDAARDLASRRVDAACMIDSNYLLFAREGILPAGSTRVLAQTGPYDHCNFTVLDDAPHDAMARFTQLLLGMSYDDEGVRHLLDLEGLRAWLPARTSGYAQLERAVDRFSAIDDFLDRAAS